MTWSIDNAKYIKWASTVNDPLKEYLTCTSHIALERSDTNKDWRVFKYILNLDREWLLYHLKMTEPVFNYNVYKLSKEEQDDIFMG